MISKEKLIIEVIKSNGSNFSKLRSNEKLIIAATTELKLQKFKNVQNRQERRKQSLTEWQEEALHGQFLRETEINDNGNR